MAEKKGTEIFESAEALQNQFNKSEEFVKKNRTVLIGVAAGIVLVAAGIWFWKDSSAKSEQEAAKAIYVSEDYFRKDSLDVALNGDGVNMGLLKIAEKYKGTKAGALANYYIGAIQLNKGKFAEAAKSFEEYNTDAFLVQARAYVLAGDAYSEQGKSKEAIEYYTKATESEPNKEFTPDYLVKLGLAYEDANNVADAVLTYEKIMSEYPSYAMIDDVKKYHARLLYKANAAKK
jgi:TolA-binding protein